MVVERRVISFAHHEDIGLDPHFVLLSECSPFRVGTKRDKDLFPMGAVAIVQHPNQDVRIVEILTDRDDFGSVLLKKLDLFFTEAT